MKQTRGDEKPVITSHIDTARTEAFSDAVFAIVITLLVLDLQVPEHQSGQLLRALLHNWPAYAAFLASFLYIGIIWLNHHALFRYIRGMSLALNWANLGVLLGAVIIPFPTETLASAFSDRNVADERVAVVLYALASGLMSVGWLVLFLVLRSSPGLLAENVRPRWVHNQLARPITGMGLYVVCGLAGWFISPVVGVVCIAVTITYHAVTSEGLSGRFMSKLKTTGR